ncbi:tumor necrosis factor receptor type 1-associated DEATH domain protein [Heteronotia binoei]|uniref:tumor necrosis factor receptor type 1-associated DEATH domain protein n=1 Tax=Heteronotia binoei TaxID=13085 RepID=UPI00292DCBF7|nr:tumor necrosis factor receptor type 1-associated DEATH domain protein [Heteronotia binoei]
MGDSADAWVGSAYLFVQSTSENILLPSLYGKPEQKPQVFKAFKLAFADSTGSLNGVDMLKVHCSDPHLIVQLKFSNRENCRKFLQSYREGALRDSLQRYLSLTTPSPVHVQMELKTGAVQLDSMLLEEERCVECISQEKPNRLRDEEITKLEESLRNLSCQGGNSSLMRPEEQSPSLDSSHPPCSSVRSPNSLPQGDTFTFQGQQFTNRKITLDDHQKFAKLVSKKWKQVGRSLQTTCRALRDPTIDNLAMEYEREGLYEQAYQMLRKFIDSEGKRATIQRLVAALEENGLISLAEELLGIRPNETAV